MVEANHKMTKVVDHNKTKIYDENEIDDDQGDPQNIIGRVD